MKLILLVLLGLVQLSSYAQGWQDKSLSIENTLNKIQFIDQNHGWIVGDSGIVLKYSDGNWITIESEYLAHNLTGLYFTDSIHGWIIGDNGVILKYDNDTISIVNSPTNNQLNDIYMIDENHGWIGGNNRTILKYSENSWSGYPTDGFSEDLGNLKDIQFLDSTFGIFIGGDYYGFTILNYEDGEWYEDNNPTNTTWLKGLFIIDKENIITSENQQLPGINWGSFINYNSLSGTHGYIGDIGGASPGCAIDFGETTGWAINGKQIFKYVDNGFVEYENYASVPHRLNSICMLNDNFGWMVGDKGMILKYNLQPSNVPEIENTRIKIYPNPFQDDVIVNSDIPLNRVELFNVAGQKMESINANNEFSLKLDYKNLPKGIYFLQLIDHDSKSVYKLIKK